MPWTPEEVQAAEKGLEVVFQPFEKLIQTLFGEAGREFGLMLGDEFRFRRQKRLITKLLPKLEQFYEASGIDPQAIPDNIWAPALQAASLWSMTRRCRRSGRRF